jgi:hypothetical protein
MRESVLAKIRERICARQLPPRVVEVHAAAPLSRIVERLAQGRKVGNTPRLRVQSGSCAGRSKVGYDRVVPVEQAVIQSLDAALLARPNSPLRGGPGL